MLKQHAKYFFQAIFLCLMLINHMAFARINKDLWPQWLVNNPLSTEYISHQPWQDFLTRYVQCNEERIHIIRYNEIKAEDIKLLNDYLQSMSKIHINNYNRQEQLAYWINIYNALTLQTIINYYPVPSIQEINISPGLFSVGPWGAKLIQVNGTALSLDDINNRIIRPIWNDPRTLYALNNASIGAPNLSQQAYQGYQINQQLNHATFSYINSLRAVSVIEGRLVVSKLYDWYEEDFGGQKNNVITHLMQFAKEPLKSQLKHINSIDSYVYNWHINK